MNKQEHTPGLWTYASTRDESTYALFDSSGACRLIFLVGGITSTHNQIMEQHCQNETDARRIVRCVNAMDGISDDNALFFPGNTVRSVISGMKLKELELEQQRDELLAVLKLCYRAMEGIEGPGFKEAKLAIAKAKGGAA